MEPVVCKESINTGIGYKQNYLINKLIATGYFLFHLTS